MRNSQHHSRPISGNRYAYRHNFENGMDLRRLSSQGDGKKAALIENLYRDKAKTTEALETFPGYRKLSKTFGLSSESLHGLYTHRFSGKDCLIVHFGHRLYLFSHEVRDKNEHLIPIAEVADADSIAFVHDGIFYLADGHNLFQISQRDRVEALGDAHLSEEDEDLGRLPATNVYIPTVYENGKRKEEKNLLTRYYEIVENELIHRRIYDHYGLRFRQIEIDGEDCLEVTGLEEGFHTVFVPNEATFYGNTLPIRKIAAGAFAGRNITAAVLSPNVETIEDDDGYRGGAFADCVKLKHVCLYGVKTIGSSAFSGCSSLEKIVLASGLHTIGEHAFQGTTSLEYLFYGGASFQSSLYDFPAGLRIRPSTFLGIYHVGDDIRIPIDPDHYDRAYRMAESMRYATAKFERFGGWSMNVFGDDAGYHAEALAPIGICGIAFDCVSSSEVDRYAFFTILGDGPLFPDEEITGSYRIPLPEKIHGIASLTVNGLSASYIGEFTAEDGVTALTSLRLSIADGDHAYVKIRIFGKENDAEEGEKLCQAKAILPIGDTVTFAAFADRPQSVAIGIIKNRLFYCPSNERRDLPFAIVGLTRSGDQTLLVGEEGLYDLDGETLIEETLLGESRYRGKRYLLLPSGLYRSEDDRPLSYHTLTKISDPIAPLLNDRPLQALTVWQGYLVILFGNDALLCDLDRTYREDGITLHPFYRLSELGRAISPKTVYHHLSYRPQGMPEAIDSVSLSILMKEEPVKGAVQEATLDGKTWYYTDENGKRYLVETDGEVIATSLDPFVKALAVGDALYFAAENGALFLVNTDKRLNGEIPNDCYTYDHRVIPSLILSESADMDAAYRPKSTVKKSMTISFVSLPYSAFTVAMADESKKFAPPMAIRAAPLLDAFDFSALSFAPTTLSTVILPDRLKHFARKSVRFSAKEYRRPMAIVSFAYTYTVDNGRVKNR